MYYHEDFLTQFENIKVYQQSVWLYIYLLYIKLEKLMADVKWHPELKKIIPRTKVCM